MDSKQGWTMFTKTSKYRYKQWLGVFGAIIVLGPQALSNIWGNMTVYVTSYFYREHGSTSIASPWALSVFMIGNNVGVNVVPYARCMGGNTGGIASLFLFNLGIFGMYLALKYGLLWLFYFSFGIAGLFCGISNQLTFKSVSDLTSSSKGLYKSLTCTGFNFGPFIINLIVGFYMNPDNVAPGMVVNNIPIFDDNDVLDKVPTLIIAQGIASFLCMFMGYCLLSYSHNATKHKRANSQITYGSIAKDNESAEIDSSFENNQEPAVAIETKGMVSISCANPEKIKSSNTTSVSIEGKSRKYSGSTSERDMTTLDILKYVPLYVMMFSYGIQVFPKLLLSNSYKTYGLIFISDDHFLVNLGSAFAITGGIARIVWGLFLDRFPIKSCLVCVYTCLSLPILLMYFAPAIDKYLYFFTVLAVTFGVNQALPAFLVVSDVYFGENNFYKVYGILCAARVPMSFIIPPVFDQLQTHFGWFGPFCCCASLSVISLILIVLIIPYIPKQNRKQ